MSQTDEEIEEMQEAEEVDSSEVPMNDDDFVAPGFKAKVLSVKVVKEFPVVEGSVDKSKGKSLYVYAELEGQKYPWKWRVSNSTQGNHHAVKEAFKEVKIVDHEENDTGEVGIDLKDIKLLKGNTFYFEKRNLKLGSFIKKNFPMPAIYYRPKPKVAEAETDGDEKTDEKETETTTEEETQKVEETQTESEETSTSDEESE